MILEYSLDFNFMKLNKILIVGGSSGLGSYLTKLYHKNKYDITTLSRNLNSEKSLDILLSSTFFRVGHEIHTPQEIQTNQ